MSKKQPQLSKSSIKTYDIHPISVRQMQKGHPWVTRDQYSENFSTREKFIIAKNKHRPFSLLLHDPTHKLIRARVWSMHGNFQQQISEFEAELTTRIKRSILKRVQAEYRNNRNHYYLVFGEGDNIPGIFVHYISGEILIQFYMDFWKPYQNFIIETIIKSINSKYKKKVSLKNIWIQKRAGIKEVAKSCDPEAIKSKELEVFEYGVNYKISIGKHYDHGIYTDMASVRGEIRETLSKATSLLNLYSYTGAFSLMALKLGVKEVTSVDLSKNYINWLEDNIQINPKLDPEKHTSLNASTHSVLKKFSKESKTVDFIISDPPSSSSDGTKRTNSLQDYKETLPLMNSILSTHGKMLIFINTHKTSMKKFEDSIKQIILSKRLPLIISKQYQLSEDCPSRAGFPEGNYLKGLLLLRVQND